MNIFSDEISETYRKYVLKIKLSDQQSYYLLWGTDVGNEDKDYLLLNTLNNIVAFPRIKDLLTFVKRIEVPIDNHNTQIWANEYKGTRAYTTYDIASLIVNLENIDSLKRCDQELAMKIVDFCNLFSDYAYQVNSPELLDLYHEDDLRVFIDGLNADFFWDKPDETYTSELMVRLKQLNFVKIKKTIENMISLFVKEIIVISYPDLPTWS